MSKPGFNRETDACDECGKTLCDYRLALVNPEGEWHAYTDICVKCARKKIKLFPIEEEFGVHLYGEPRPIPYVSPPILKGP